MREIRPSGSMSGRWKRSRACGSEPRRGNPATRTYRRLNHRATSRLYRLSGEGMDVGMDCGSAVDFTYKLPFKFTGKIDKVTVELK
jgi:hypothetical protein